MKSNLWSDQELNQKLKRGYKENASVQIHPKGPFFEHAQNLFMGRHGRSKEAGLTLVKLIASSTIDPSRS